MLQCANICTMWRHSIFIFNRFCEASFNSHGQSEPEFMVTQYEYTNSEVVALLHSLFEKFVRLCSHFFEGNACAHNFLGIKPVIDFLSGPY